MQVAHKTNELNAETIDALETLLKLNIDSAKGFAAAADKMENPAYADAFRRVGMERKSQADELARYVKLNGEDPPDNGTIKGAAHRTWLKVRDLFASGDGAVLSEAERGEDYIKDAYKDAIVKTAGSPMSTVLHNQFKRVKRQHDAVRDLRDQEEARQS